MIPYSLGYLIGALLNLALCAGIFLRRRDLRRGMLEMSLWAVAIGLPHEYWLWTRDWWCPPTLSGTPIGVEDVLYAMGTGGLLAGLYAFVLRRRGQADRPVPGWPARLTPLALDLVTPLVLVPALGLHSFVACAIGVLLAVGWIVVRRPDLIGVAAGSAALGMLVAPPGYWVIEWLCPGFIRAVWDPARLSGLHVAGIPLEDLAWYAYSAMLFGIYYPYATGQRLTRRGA